MNATQRRQEITHILQHCDAPQSASTLAALLSVSRQIIVGDIALLRAAGVAISATPRGYVLHKPTPPIGLEKTIVCIHENAHMAEELYTVVDLGGSVLDVTVEHSVYGEICAPLHIFSRYDVDLFLQKVAASGARPLCALTGGVHLHRLRCPDEIVFARITQSLQEKGILYPS